MTAACSIRVRGVVQGVGFRPFVYRLAQANTLSGWVLNGEQGVEIFLEGQEQALDQFVHELTTNAPPAATIAELAVESAQPQGFRDFSIRESQHAERPTVRVSPDLPVCHDCLAELYDPSDPRYRYPYINCTNCGPRYTVTLALPYDRANTTMQSWPLDDQCSREYHDPLNRRFHAQPVACPCCGPHYVLQQGSEIIGGESVITKTAELLAVGRIVAVKGLGGYHLACDARNIEAVRALRVRKFRKEKPFALMARDLSVASTVIELSKQTEDLLKSIARPIALAPAKVNLPDVAPDNYELGIMLPYTPLHHLLFAAGAPDLLVMTSANRSSEPIAYDDHDALESLAGIADAFLIGERPIARRVDDSVARAGVFGPVVLRRARGYAPAAVTTLPATQPILALGADLKNSITLVVEGQAFVSQHIGDLDHYGAFRAFQETIRDLLEMYELRAEEVILAHDLHPQYRSTVHGSKMLGLRHVVVQHHRAHVASVLAERGDWDASVIGVSFDGTGYGDDGTIWGGEVFTGSVRQGFERVAHLRPAALPGGDAAAEFPVQAAAGFLSQIEDLPDFSAAPFIFPTRFRSALQLVNQQVRSFTTTSVGRLFDTAAALLGFTRKVTFEGQAAMWLEQLAKRGSARSAYPFPYEDGELDFRPLLRAVVEAQLRGQRPEEIARGFQLGIAAGLADCVTEIRGKQAIDTVVLSGGVFQNQLLLEDLKTILEADGFTIWTNHAVPPNDGGISLGQAAMAIWAGDD